MPQCSVLGPVLFTLYTGPIGQIIRHHELDFHTFTDDAQLYVSFKINAPTDEKAALTRIQACVRELKSWLNQHRLHLNDNKTEVLVITTPSSANTHSVTDVIGGDSIIRPTAVARNIGVMFDNELSLKSQVSKLCQVAFFFYTRRIRSIRDCLTHDATELLIHSLVISRLDYGNGLLYGVSGQLFCKGSIMWQRALLSRLPIRYRTEYKLLLLTFNALHHLAPSYLTDLLQLYHPTRTL